MALSPDDVLNKTFTTTQFRRGYDEREVDDFLDDIVVEMRRAAKDVEELRGQLDDCREGRGLEPLPAAAPAGSGELDAEVASLRDRNAELEGKVKELQGRLAESEESFAAFRAQVDTDRASWDEERSTWDNERAASAQGQAEFEQAGANHEEELAVLRERAAEAERDAQARVEAAEARAAEAIAAGDWSKKALEAYPRRWHREHGRGIKAMATVRRSVLKFTDERFDRLVAVAAGLPVEEMSAFDIILRVLRHDPGLLLAAREFIIPT